MATGQGCSRLGIPIRDRCDSVDRLRVVQLPEPYPLGPYRYRAVVMPFGLYLHFPFCRNRCSYCDFYKELFDAGLEAQFYDALRTETELCAEAHAGHDREISTIFIGGGTPSLTNLSLLADWLTLVRTLFTVPAGIEFSIETNPESVTLENLTAFKQMGVNRPLFGIQSFNLALLKLLDRRHNPDDSYRAIYNANVLGFDNFGVDMIFGLPGQSMKMLSRDIDEFVDLNPPHISFYQLTVEHGTPLARKVETGKLVMPNQESSMAMYRGGIERFTEAAYHRYEVSSLARPGFECRHNLGYWEGREYLGLGPSAHSFMQGKRFANLSSVRDYLASLKSGVRPIVYDESGIEDRMVEAIMLGLRMARGIDRHQFAARFGRSLESRFDPHNYDLLRNSGHIVDEDGVVRLSDEGILLADEITRRLLK
ncbi:coproporphyrinogen III oxidase [candidate division GN15 bacterium]|uniref:Heme chaperone HemW n=1 Tax=candidate division GN15 bacterium TaxID=2072418 RepID=A0A855XBH9_9BACT|nr:MAG: coproporphyrinogen III oxidase [candidate division GN15 bacterium]